MKNCMKKGINEFDMLWDDFDKSYIWKKKKN